ncbi:MAG: ferrochelatase [Candidatus Rokubacteria bacterium]|nr:ferrochelatase [Candidatus Rokubacteria bacterium]
MIDSVLLIAFGGPTRPEEIRPFLATVTRGRRIPPERVDEVAHHYERIGGRSPLNELTFKQAAGLAAALARKGIALPVFVGMRNWHPYLAETLAEMAEKGCRHALGIILSSLQTEAAWERYQDNVAEARATVGPAAPAVTYAPPWSDHPRFIEAVADQTRAVLDAIPPARRPETPLVFTAHSVPVAMAERSPYVAQLTQASRLVADQLGHRRWRIAYQSRSGSPLEPWLEPDIGEVIRDVARDRVADLVVVPIGFVVDHVEVLYDLDVEARGVAAGAGVRLHRAQAVNDHPALIAMLADLVEAGPARQ